MREAIRYFTPEKLEIFIKIPFLIHINSPGYPGFVDSKTPAHGIWHFEESGFFKEAQKTKIFPKSIIETINVKQSFVNGFYHIGSLGTFTQSGGSDFDFWVIIDKKKFSKERYENLEKKLDGILKHCREEYSQEVSFFIMDQKEIRQNFYASYEGEEALSAPKIFLKEEFYRTFLMIAGKIPLWAVLPEKIIDAQLNMEGITSQALAMYDDLIDLGTIDRLPEEDVLKGLLWHICKSQEDPVKALIKSTMVFSYGFGKKISKQLLCEKIKQDYPNAGIDDYGTDPYKSLFDRILEFHELEEPKTVNLIKNAIFFRLCGYPDIKMPENKTPKLSLLRKYISNWKLNKNQVAKLLAYNTWSESEKLLLEQTIINRLAQMYNHALKSMADINAVFENPDEKTNWTILRNKTKHRLKKSPDKIPECSTFIRRQNISNLDIIETPNLWKLNIQTHDGQNMKTAYKHIHFLGLLGWIFENGLYNRQTSTITIHSDLWLYESLDKPVNIDSLYMSLAPLKPLSDTSYARSALWLKMVVVLFYDTQVQKDDLVKAEFMVLNTWGELYFEAVDFEPGKHKEACCRVLAKKMSKYRQDNLRVHIYQFSNAHDPDIVYLLKKAYNDETNPGEKQMPIKKKPYLDKL